MTLCPIQYEIYDMSVLILFGGIYIWIAGTVNVLKSSITLQGNIIAQGVKSRIDNFSGT